MAFQVKALIDAFATAGGPQLKELRTDGGAATSNLLLELQANVLGIPVFRPANLDTTGLGAAYLGGLGAGIWSSPAELATQVRETFRPTGSLAVEYERWLEAVQATRSW